MRTIFVFHFWGRKWAKTLIRQSILSIGPFPESGLERDSGLVWSKKFFQKFFRICSAAILTSSAHVPFPFTRFHIRSNPGIVRILRQYCRTWYRRFSSLYLYVKSGEHNNTNFIRCRGFESKDLKNDGARENFNFSLKNWRKIWISFLAQPGRKLN